MTKYNIRKQSILTKLTSLPPRRCYCGRLMKYRRTALDDVVDAICLSCGSIEQLSLGDNNIKI